MKKFHIVYKYFHVTNFNIFIYNNNNIGNINKIYIEKELDAYIRGGLIFLQHYLI